MDYIERAMSQRFSDAGASSEITLIGGARQVGKTTLLRHLGKDAERAYADLDDPMVRLLAQEDPAAFLENYPPPVFIDEVQNAPELVPHIAGKASESQTPNMFWVAGSRESGAMQQLGEELDGRVESVHLQGLSQREKAGLPPERLSFGFDDLIQRREAVGGAWSPDDVAGHVWNGGLPAFQLDNASRDDLRELFDPYIMSYILRDVSELGGVRNLRRFSRFLHACAFRNARPVNYTQLAADADVTIPTAKSWVGVLQDLGIIYLLMPFESDTFKRVARTPKMYFTDTGLAAYLAACPSPEALFSESYAGAFFENYVVMELISNLEAAGEPYSLSCFRDSNHNEIDIVIERGDEIIPLDIRLSPSPVTDDTRIFAILDRKGISRNPGGIVCMIPEPVQLSDFESLIPSFIL